MKPAMLRAKLQLFSPWESFGALGQDRWMMELEDNNKLS